MIENFVFKIATIYLVADLLYGRTERVINNFLSDNLKQKLITSRDGLARREFGSFPVGHSTVCWSSSKLTLRS